MSRPKVDGVMYVSCTQPQPLEWPQRITRSPPCLPLLNALPVVRHVCLFSRWECVLNKKNKKFKKINRRACMIQHSTFAGVMVTNVHITKEIIAPNIHCLPHNLLVLVYSSIGRRRTWRRRTARLELPGKFKNISGWNFGVKNDFENNSHAPHRTQDLLRVGEWQPNACTHFPRLSLKLVVEHKIWDRASQIFASRWLWK